MSERISKNTTTKKVTQAKYNGGYKSGWGKQELTCACCNEKFIHYADEITYKIKDKVFCKWSCKCKYKRELEAQKNDK